MYLKSYIRRTYQLCNLCQYLGTWPTQTPKHKQIQRICHAIPSGSQVVCFQELANSAGDDITSGCEPSPL